MSELSVSLVIPCRNAQSTIEDCLKAVVPLLGKDGLERIIVVDDGSTDRTAEIVGQFPVDYVLGKGNGAGSARNIGWRLAESPLVWFVDSDCVAEEDALSLLVPHMEDPQVGGVSGSYGNMRPDSLLSCLIHEEIVERHVQMPERVDFLATFNVLYRRDILEKIGGFDERFLKGQDAELSWRVLENGYQLGFEFRSKVKHFHPSRWGSYLRTQRQQGYWRLLLHLTHGGHSAGDSYSNILDHLQPPLAMLVLASLPLALIPFMLPAPMFLLGLLLLSCCPMAWRITRRTRSMKYLVYIAMSSIRAFYRGIGLTHATINHLIHGNPVQPEE